MHIWHIAMHASSIDIMTAGVAPCIRSIVRIIVLHMSAQFMHTEAHDIPWVEHTTQACSHAEQASIQACMSCMSMVLMPAFDMSSDIMSIIIESTSRSFHFTSWRRPPPTRTLLLAAFRVTGSRARSA